MDGGVLQEIGIAVGAALLLSLLFNRIGLPMTVGQIFAGMIVGPYGVGLIQDLPAINVLASLGIVLRRPLSFRLQGSSFLWRH